MRDEASAQRRQDAAEQEAAERELAEAERDRAEAAERRDAAETEVASARVARAAAEGERLALAKAVASDGGGTALASVRAEPGFERPLDVVNVERSCDLLVRMSLGTETRYLIVTHNAVTMSRMHRLYGVTMLERGISRLLSVDLGGAEALLAAE